MDADDISQPAKFPHQFEYMEKTGYRYPGGMGLEVRREKEIFAEVPGRQSYCPSIHAVRQSDRAPHGHDAQGCPPQRAALRYKPDCPAVPDFELRSRCHDCCSLDNIPAPLLGWRHSHSGVTSSRLFQSNPVSMNIVRKTVEKMDVAVGEQWLLFHREVGNGSGLRTLEELGSVEEWLEYL